ncbi:hypothetical protein J6590_019231 [Homalodisca vitripennis]|nr:hypothetical protein J6590_019231 [Homalodisca vitripennis]
MPRSSRQRQGPAEKLAWLSDARVRQSIPGSGHGMDTTMTLSVSVLGHKSVSKMRSWQKPTSALFPTTETRFEFCNSSQCSSRNPCNRPVDAILNRWNCLQATTGRGRAVCPGLKQFVKKVIEIDFPIVFICNILVAHEQQQKHSGTIITGRQPILALARRARSQYDGLPLPMMLTPMTTVQSIRPLHKPSPGSVAPRRNGKKLVYRRRYAQCAPASLQYRFH